MYGHELLLNGAVALSEVSQNGIRVDVDYYRKLSKELGRKIEKLQGKIDQEYGGIWRKTFGDKTNLNSRDQLGKMLFEQLGHVPEQLTKGGKYSTSEEALGQIDSPLVKWFFEIQSMGRFKTTYADGFVSEAVDGYIHPFYGLHTTRTFRSSSSNPNFQNIPKRDPEIMKMIRKGIYPRHGHCIVEADYGAVEVRISACYHHDQNMISYIKDESKDMHRDMAAQIFMVEPGEVSKEMRYCAKNMFVFPQFYGRTYHNCSISFWNAIRDMDLRTVSGESVTEILKQNKIKKLGSVDFDEKPKRNTFAWHVKNVENDFWNNRFRQYNRWKQKWYYDYLDRGYFETKTGFRIKGPMNRKNVINYPIQGSAFHCLLVSVIVLQERLKRYRMKSKIIGQVHDSIVADVHESEFEDYVCMAREVMEEEVPKIYDWIIVPLVSEAEATEIDGSWDELFELEFV